MLKCPICDKEFEPKNGNQKYCTNKCERSIRTSCANCEEEVIRYKRKQTEYFCSRLCAELYNGRAVARSCESCGVKFTIKTSALKYGYGKYCSKECHNKSMIVTRFSVCQTCKAIFEVPHNGSGGKFCSRECSHESLRIPIDKELLIDLYVDKELTSREIGEIIGRDKKVVIDYLRYHDIEVRPDGIKNREKIRCKDGHMVRSYYERAFDNYLFKEGIKHKHDYRLPFDKRYMADFKVKDVYIEIWGMMSWDKYRKRRKRKLKLYKDNNCKLLEVFPEDFKQLENKIEELKHLIS